jgi:DNA-3-methyladenine glycosylase
MQKLERSFYLDQNTEDIARNMLGKLIIHNSEEERTAVRIVEVEAYIGPADKASHAYRNLYSNRTAIQFGLGGHAYVYQIYGMYFCFNVVTQGENRPEVVLVRAGEPVMGVDIMSRRRGMAELPKSRIKNLTNGPGKLCIALGISRQQYGADLCGDRLYLADDGFKVKKSDIIATPRINIEYAEEYKDKMWRWYLKGNSFVSKI